MLQFKYNSRNIKESIYFVLTLMMLLFSVQAIHHNNDDDGNDDGNVNTNWDINEDSLENYWPLNFLYFKNLPPHKVKQIPGKILQISCEVVGKPLPTVKWIVGDYPTSELKKQDTNVESTKSSTYGKVKATHIIDYVLHKPIKYTCVAHDGTRTIHATTIAYPSKHHHVKHFNAVQQQDDIVESLQKPNIIYSHLAHFDTIGSSVVLPCRVYAKPSAEISWLDSRLNRIQQNDHFKLLPSGDLLITELQMSDIGIYQCMASNLYGIDTVTSSVYSLGK